MKLLILGGPKFLGRYLIHAALARNHEVTLFNRQQTNPQLFPEVQKLRGNRDGDLQTLHGRRWDAVIDTCGYTPNTVRATTKLLTDSVDHYTFISSISAYRNFTRPGLDESSPVEQLAEGVSEDDNSNTYGARKALCERAAEEIMPGRVFNVRPGMIIGPHDESGRFLYWVRRLAMGGEVLAPGRPDSHVQLLDVRDLADWIIRMVESRKIGVYNATGPASVLTFQQMLAQSEVAVNSDVRMMWLDDAFLLEHGVKPFSDLPFWIPSETHKGFFAIDGRQAFASGLFCRPLAETAGDTLAWDTAAGVQRQFGLTLERERQLLSLWKDSNANESKKNEAGTA